MTINQGTGSRLYPITVTVNVDGQRPIGLPLITRHQSWEALADYLRSDEFKEIAGGVSTISISQDGADQRMRSANAK